MAKIAMIAAFANDSRVIGESGKMPWHYPEDLKRFKSLTVGGTVVMGRKTFESIGRPLPNRTNIVLSRTMGNNTGGVTVCDGVDSVLGLATTGTLWVIGGQAVYEAFLPLADEIHITVVPDAVTSGDAYFPEILGHLFEQVDQEEGPRGLLFQTFRRLVEPEPR